MSKPIPPARLAQVGMIVRKQNVNDPYAHDHQIRSYEVLEDRNIKITTNQGEWTFRADEPVTFPRRPDNSIVDWRTDRTHQPVYPTPLQLAVGDLLDPQSGPYQGIDDQDREGETQCVTAITRFRNRPLVIYVTTSSGWGTRRWIFDPNELIRFPHARTERATGYDRFEIKLEGFGPYQRPDGAMIFYIKHPAGGGRWPAWLANPVKIGDEIYFARPPASNEFWPPFAGEGRWDRHPKDPQWGIDVEIDHEPDPERVTAALQAYADYRKRAGAED